MPQRTSIAYWYISRVLESYSVRLGASRWRSLPVVETARSALKWSRRVSTPLNVTIVSIGFTACAVLASHTPSTAESWTTHVTAPRFHGCVSRVRRRPNERQLDRTRTLVTTVTTAETILPSPLRTSAFQRWKAPDCIQQCSELIHYR